MSDAAIEEGAEASPSIHPLVRPSTARLPRRVAVASPSFVALPAAQRRAAHSLTHSSPLPLLLAAFGVALNFDSTENGSGVGATRRRARERGGTTRPTERRLTLIACDAREGGGSGADEKMEVVAAPASARPSLDSIDPLP